MTPGPDWTPDPQLLAAFFDGELDGRADQAELRMRIAAWVEQHPAGRDECEAQHRLRQLWRETTPTDPGPAAWQHTLEKVRHHRPAAPFRGSAALLATATVAASVALLLWWNLRPAQPLPPVAVRPAAVEPAFPVVGPGEVTIVRIDGDDTGAIVVGTLPVAGALELASPGEVQVTSIQPDADDRRTPQVRVPFRRPMVFWVAEGEHYP